MNPALLPLLRCPACEGSPLEPATHGLTCSRCRAKFGNDEGFIDLHTAPAREVITPFQRIMQTPLVVSIYEKWWRRAGYRLASSRSFDEELKTILGFSFDLAARPALDVACGPGVFARPLARSMPGLVVGVDLSRPMLRSAVRGDRLENLEFVRATVFRLPFGSGVFRLVNCCGALHLFEDPRHALAELIRVLAPGGLLTVQTTIRPRRSVGMAWFLERWIRFGFFAEDELLELLSANGLTIQRIERHRISISFAAARKF